MLKDCGVINITCSQRCQILADFHNSFMVFTNKPTYIYYWFLAAKGRVINIQKNKNNCLEQQKEMHFK